MIAFNFLRVIIIVLGILLSACAPPANSSAPVGGGKVQPDITFTGAIENMNGNQWVVNGKTIKVVQSVLRDGPFSVGDTIKVEASIAADGSVLAQRVEAQSANEALVMSTSAPEDSKSTLEVVSTSAPTQVSKFNDKGNEAVGAVDAITNTSITIAGQMYTFAPGAEIKGTITAGLTVKLHFTTTADGTRSVTEVEIAALTTPGDNPPTNVSDDHSSTSTSADDHGGAGDNSGGSSGG